MSPPPFPSGRERKQDANGRSTCGREQILDAANALFADHGHEEVTVEDVARSAGAARGLVHHYFGGREAVYLALLERLGAGREERLRRRAVALVATLHADIAEDSPRLRYALECWTASTGPRRVAGYVAKPTSRRRRNCSS